MLAGYDYRSWLFGGPILLALSVWKLDAQIGQKTHFRLEQLIWFAPYFLWRSIVGSCDVAWRALHWQLPISPAMHQYAFRLPPDSAARVVFANCINLLPGTVSVAWQGDVLQVHFIADTPDAMQAIRQLEARVARLFGYDLSATFEEPSA